MGRINTQIWITGKEEYDRNTDTDVEDVGLFPVGGILINKKVFVSQWYKKIIAFYYGEVTGTWDVGELYTARHNNAPVIFYLGFFIDKRLAIQWRGGGHSGVIFPTPGGGVEWWRFEAVGDDIETVGGTDVAGGWYGWDSGGTKGVLLKISEHTAKVTLIDGETAPLCLSPAKVGDKYYFAFSDNSHSLGVLMTDNELTPVKMVVTPTTAEQPRGNLRYVDNRLIYVGIENKSGFILAEFDVDLNVIRAKRYSFPATGWPGLDAAHKLISIGSGGDLYVWGFDEALNLTPGTKLSVFPSTSGVTGYALEPSPGLVVSMMNFTTGKAFVSKLPPAAIFTATGIGSSPASPPPEASPPTFLEVPISYSMTTWELTPTTGTFTPVTADYTKITYSW